MINFSASITATSVTFLGSAVNNGTINSNVTFKGTSRNSGSVNGNATFLNESLNAGGTVSGTMIFDPPLLAMLIKLAFAPGEPWTGRKLGTYRKYGGEIVQDYPTQACPSPNDGCYSYPDTYKALVPNLPYVLDYKNHPEYCEQPGNSCS